MEPDELVAGRYRLVSLIGRGAMGVVWLAKDERLDREVAVKELLLEKAPAGTADEAIQRALREGRIAARLRHPNAIAVHDVVTHAGRPCLVMEYLRSESLGTVATTRGGLRPRQAAAIGAQVAAALAAAHTAGIVHRDIKPDNVLITEDGTAKITDFGVSRAAGDASVTATGILAGTPAYLAPEVAGGADADPRSDVFSLGATLYAVIEGEPPFGVDNNPIAQLHRVATGQINPPRRAGPLTDVLLWLLRRDPAERPTMPAAQEVLAAAASGKKAAVPPPHTPTLMMQLPRRRRVSRRAVVAGVAAAALVAAGVVVGTMLNRPDDTEAATTPGTSTTTSEPAPTCSAEYVIANSWPGGYQVRITIKADKALTGWAVSWPIPDGHGIINLWNGVLTKDGKTATTTNADWNVNVAAGGTAEVGFTATAQNDERPIQTVTCQER